MTTVTIPHPPIVSGDQWLAERKKLLADEKELTRHYDRVNAGRRRLPMVKVEKDYMLSTAQVVQGVSRISSRVVANSSSITICSTPHGTMGAPAARVS